MARCDKKHNRSLLSTRSSAQLLSHCVQPSETHWCLCKSGGVGTQRRSYSIRCLDLLCPALQPLMGNTGRTCASWNWKLGDLVRGKMAKERRTRRVVPGFSRKAENLHLQWMPCFQKGTVHIPSSGDGIPLVSLWVSEWVAVSTCASMSAHGEVGLGMMLSQKNPTERRVSFQIAAEWSGTSFLCGSSPPCILLNFQAEKSASFSPFHLHPSH